MKKIIALVMVLACVCALLVGCSEADKVNANISKQADYKKAIYGGALLLSERAAAERAAAHVWKLSEREERIIAELSKKNSEA